MNSNDISFLTDDPIEKPEQDRLNRNRFVETLADQIIKVNRPESLIIGIHAPWGSGKSSVLNLLEDKLQRCSSNPNTAPPIVIRFNPWNFSTIDQLIFMFFREVRIAIKQRDNSEVAKKIGSILEALGTILSPLSIVPAIGGATEIFSKVLKSIGAAIKRIVKDRGLLELKSSLNNLLDEYNRKLVVLIDDVDRLDKESIRLFFRLIRLNADFHHTIYVLAFDRLIVEKALEPEQEISGRDYLEKIVQVSFDLPPPDPSLITKLLFGGMDGVLGNMLEEWDERRWGNLYHAGFKQFFKTLRDVKRYVNGLRVTFPMVREEVSPVDFIGLEVIRVFCPDVYKGISKSKEIFTNTDGIYLNANSEDIQSIRSELKNLFSGAGEEFQSAVCNICRQLFPQIGRIYGNGIYRSEWQSTWRREKRICAEDIFDKYFFLGVPEGEISESEIRAAISMTGDREVFANILNDFNGRGLVRRFLERMLDFTNDFPVENAPTTIGALLDVGDYLPRENLGSYDLGTDTQIYLLVYRLLKRIEDVSQRAETLRNISETANSLYTTINVIAGLEPDQEEEPVISSERFDEIRQIICEKIRNAANEEKLSKVSNLRYILFKWRDWSCVDEPREYVSQLISTDDGLLEFLTGFLQEIRVQALAEYVSRKHWIVRREDISEFVNSDELIPRVQQIRERQSSFLNARQKLALEAFLNPSQEPFYEQRR